MKKAVKSLKIIGNIFLWLFVIFSIVITMIVLSAQQNADRLPSVGGKYLINILTDSMSPTFSSGDIIIGERLTDEQKLYLEVGDVITFYADLDGDGLKELNTHRIVEVNENPNTEAASSYITKGDNEETNIVVDDDPVLWQNVICKWTGKKIPLIGKATSFLQTSRMGFFLVIVLPLLAFFLYELYRFALTIYRVRHGGKKQITAADEELIKQKAIEEYLKKQAEESAQADKTADDVTSDSTSDDVTSDEKTDEMTTEVKSEKEESVD